MFQVKVREATSNDPGCASPTLIMEIAGESLSCQLFNPNFFILSGKIFSFTFYQKPIISVLSHDRARVPEVMNMIFTRLGDHRVFRHVIKSLVLLEKLIIVGSAQVS